MKEAILDIIADFIQQRSRLCFDKHKRTILKQRLEERSAHLGLPDLTTYWNYLRNTIQEESTLLDLITINETSFFRNPGQFQFLTKRIIPELEARKGAEVIRSWGSAAPVPPGSIMKVRILCAGCSTGEEPYSVAMALSDGLRYPRAWDIRILAGDLSASCIRTASAGYYGTDRLKGLPVGYAGKYMESHGAGSVVKNEVKRLVTFCHMNLVDVINGEPLPGSERDNELFDIIFCRNVMIYFSSETQQQLVGSLFHLLTPGGYLFTGDAEPLHLYKHDFEPVREAGCLIYKKMETLNHVEAL
jgi:chemotaxis protein methyltransferase CheR